MRVNQVKGRQDDLIAIIAHNHYDLWQPGVNFLTPPELSLQFGVLKHPAGHKIPAHTHVESPREVKWTQEALFIRKGRLLVDFYDVDRSYLGSAEVREGDVVLLVAGGHGFEVLHSCEIYECKMGPFAGPADKERFESVPAGERRRPAYSGVEEV